jgi:hypothetical protein
MKIIYPIKCPEINTVFSFDACNTMSLLNSSKHRSDSEILR